VLIGEVLAQGENAAYKAPEELLASIAFLKKTAIQFGNIDSPLVIGLNQLIDENVDTNSGHIKSNGMLHYSCTWYKPYLLML
jgi:hypothetical protein